MQYNVMTDIPKIRLYFQQLHLENIATWLNMCANKLTEAKAVDLWTRLNTNQTFHKFYLSFDACWQAHWGPDVFLRNKRSTHDGSCSLESLDSENKTETFFLKLHTSLTVPLKLAETRSPRTLQTLELCFRNCATSASGAITGSIHSKFTMKNLPASPQPSQPYHFHKCLVHPHRCFQQDLKSLKLF